jgi:hypothetical protein
MSKLIHEIYVLQGSLMTWNVTDLPLEKQAEVVIQNPERLVWINSIFISEGSIWIATNRDVTNPDPFLKNLL